MEIIDNMFQTGEVEDIYGDLPARLVWFQNCYNNDIYRVFHSVASYIDVWLYFLQHDCFCHWLSIYDVPKEREIFNLIPVVVRMGWQTVENTVDCGIFTMRHMETYMGNLFRWKVGLRDEKVSDQMLYG